MNRSTSYALEVEYLFAFTAYNCCFLPARRAHLTSLQNTASVRADLLWHPNQHINQLHAACGWHLLSRPSLQNPDRCYLSPCTPYMESVNGTLHFLRAALLSHFPLHCFASLETKKGFYLSFPWGTSCGRTARKKR